MIYTYFNKISKYHYRFFVYVVISIPVIFLSSCLNTSMDSQYSPHPILTIDKKQVREYACTFLYKTNNKETGWNYASATANTLKILKDQVLVTQGNALVIDDVYPSVEYRNGYDYEAATMYVSVYKCPTSENVTSL
tara:strand:- start:500 stop:907 length:408 start_codon:yes stop_codon:yes gene_type:complete